MLSTSEIPSDCDSDELVWLWNDLEKSWMHVMKCVVPAYRDSRGPQRYPYWRPGDEIQTPDQISSEVALQDLADQGQTMDMWG